MEKWGVAREAPGGPEREATSATSNLQGNSSGEQRGQVRGIVLVEWFSAINEDGCPWSFCVWATNRTVSIAFKSPTATDS